MYRHINRHIKALLVQLRERDNEHVRDYDNLMGAFARSNTAVDVETITAGCLEVYDALVKEYDRILENRLLDESIVCFRKELNPETFTDIKIIDSLLWAFVTWARQGPPFVKGELQYE